MIQFSSNITKKTRRLSQVRNLLRGIARKETLTVAEEFERVAKEYPPETDANRPPAPYYTRGVGRISKNGSISPTSQKLGDGWKIEDSRDEFKVENSATYAPWVVGTKTQARWMARIGWRTIRAMLKLIGIKGDENSSSIIDEKTSFGRKISQRARDALNKFINS